MKCTIHSKSLVLGLIQTQVRLRVRHVVQVLLQVLNHTLQYLYLHLTRFLLLSQHFLQLEDLLLLL